MNASSYRATQALIGIFLGLGAPLSILVIRLLLTGNLSLDGASREIGRHSLFYGYLAAATPVIFALFGFYLGFVIDRVSGEKMILEAEKNILESQSMTDDVTGLYNHRHILVEIEREVDRARRYQRDISGMMIDIDSFKKTNDTYGHLVGDWVLKQVAKVIQESLRRVDIVGRYGGDEFLVILPETDGEAARLVAERLLKNVREYPFRVKGVNLELTVSIGVYDFKNAEVFDAQLFIDKIDQAMLEAKRIGKNTYVFGHE